MSPVVSPDSLNPTGTGTFRAISFGVYTVTWDAADENIAVIVPHTLAAPPTVVVLTPQSVPGTPLYAQQHAPADAANLYAEVSAPQTRPATGTKVYVHWIAIL